MIHELKTWPEYFMAIARGYKTFEIRKNDRGFKTGDILWLKKYDPQVGYMGMGLQKRVDYILYGPAFGIEEGYCVMSLKSIEP